MDNLTHSGPLALEAQEPVPGARLGLEEAKWKDLPIPFHKRAVLPKSKPFSEGLFVCSIVLFHLNLGLGPNGQYTWGRMGKVLMFQTLLATLTAQRRRRGRVAENL